MLGGADDDYLEVGANATGAILPTAAPASDYLTRRPAARTATLAGAQPGRRTAPRQRHHLRRPADDRRAPHRRRQRQHRQRRWRRHDLRRAARRGTLTMPGTHSRPWPLWRRQRPSSSQRRTGSSAGHPAGRPRRLGHADHRHRQGHRLGFEEVDVLLGAGADQRRSTRSSARRITVASTPARHRRHWPESAHRSDNLTSSSAGRSSPSPRQRRRHDHDLRR